MLRIFFCFLFSVWITAWGSAGTARAAFIEQMAVDARAIALGNSVTADPPGLSAIHYNPAGLHLLPEGKLFTSGLTVPFIKITSSFEADPDFDGFFGGYNDDPLSGTQGSNSSGRMYVPIVNEEVNFLVAPILGMTYRAPKSRWSFAIGNYVPFGVGFNHKDPADPVRFGAKYAYVQHLVYAAPSVSYKLTDTLSAGVTVGVGQTALGVGVDMRSPNDLVALTRVLGDATRDLEIPIVSELTFPPPWFGGGIGPYDQVASLQLSTRDDFSPNWNVGLLWEPLRWLSLGMVYQSEIKVQLTGRYRFDYTEVFQQTVDWMGSSPTLLMLAGMLKLPFNAVPYQSGTVYSEYKFPQRVQMGVKLKPFERLSLLADLHWADWSSLKEDRFVFDQDIQLLQVVRMLGYTGGDNTLVLQRDFKDTWHWSAGLEFKLTDWLSMMLGYERRPTSVNLIHWDNIYSLPDLESYCAGFSLKFKSGTQVDLGFAYLINEGLKVHNDSSDLMNSTDPFTPVYNPYAGLNYSQKTETYLASFKVTMPLEVMSEMLHDTLSLLNPFSSGKKNGAGRIHPKPDAKSALDTTHAIDQPVLLNEFESGSKQGSPKYTVELGRFTSAERACIAKGFYLDAGLKPELRALKDENGATIWVIQVGHFDSRRRAGIYQTYHGLVEANIQPLDQSMDLSVRYALRLGGYASLDRARMASEFYLYQGFDVRVQPAEQGFALLMGDFESEGQARAYAATYALTEAEAVPFAKQP